MASFFKTDDGQTFLDKLSRYNDTILKAMDDQIVQRRRHLEEAEAKVTLALQVLAQTEADLREAQELHNIAKTATDALNKRGSLEVASDDASIKSSTSSLERSRQSFQSQSQERLEDTLKELQLARDQVTLAESALETARTAEDHACVGLEMAERHHNELSALYSRQSSIQVQIAVEGLAKSVSLERFFPRHWNRRVNTKDTFEGLREELANHFSKAPEDIILIYGEKEINVKRDTPIKLQLNQGDRRIVARSKSSSSTAKSM